MDDVTRMLNALAAGETAPETTLLEVLYEELHQMASGKMAGERTDHTLQPTALVHEAYLRLAGGQRDWKNRRHFFGAASEAMRRILVEAARRRSTVKRGSGKQAEPFDDEQHPPPEQDERLLLIHEALDGLEQEDPELALVVKLRYFVGLSNGEIAELLAVNERTVRRRWDEAKLSLYRSIKGDTRSS